MAPRSGNAADSRRFRTSLMILPKYRTHCLEQARPGNGAQVRLKLESERLFPVKPFRSIALAVLVLSAGAMGRPATREIYPDPAQARVEIASALKSAAQTHRRILLDFGGNWCGDCQVLDIYFHNAANKPILDANFVLV